MNIIGKSCILFLWGRQSIACAKSVGGDPLSRRCASTCLRASPTEYSEYICDIDAEPLHRYRPGGYHAVRLGDILNDGRYKILHKLGWGGYSTVWAARDLKDDRYVALKIMVSDPEKCSQESKVMEAINATGSGHPGFQHLLSMMNHFHLNGPNGTHNCLVLELLGPSVAELVERRYSDERLPGALAKSIARQALLGLDCLHEHKIAHGDLHTRNLLFTIPSIQGLQEQELLAKLKPPETAIVKRKDGKVLCPGVPEYLVRPTCYPAERSLSTQRIKIADFGESFLGNEVAERLHTPLVVRAPEAIFGDRLDYRVDLWSMGCMLFELVTGQPPFDSIMIKPVSLVSQMLETTGEDLPERWKPTWHIMNGINPNAESGITLQDWLEEVYFHDGKKVDFGKEDILKLGKLVHIMLRFEPPARASARDILNDPWFQLELP
ncbi:kinase-like protein [Xylona heveae TC161]|uniref:non-specific serine/threonine protein kinase n=1 Tax=Xylona heveae (strain CBS 132557 / TC161) TaxID=1328760 RepID=A0A165J792_XYLHT|nr:kinase-like protein [Xylona heveae TC161]KZF25835.1 kinase-like protein [Xylona heveae TC161]